MNGLLKGGIKMKIYVVETMYDYTTHLGFSTSKKVAEKIAKEYTKKYNHSAWVREYKEDKNLWCDFEMD